MQAALRQPEQRQRPILRYYGGKAKIASWIVSHFPRHCGYVEPFFGAGSVLFAKPPSRWETVSDLDDEIVNLFTTLRGPRADELIRAVTLTCYAEAEYDLAFQPSLDSVERARRLIVRSHMGFGTAGTQTNRRKGFRADGPNANTRVAVEWSKLPDSLARAASRLSNVVIRRRDAFAMLESFDGPETLFYLDPPYLPDTRNSKVLGDELYHAYAHELTEQDHERLLDRCLEAKAMIAISGYESDLYARKLHGWRLRRKRTTSLFSLPRVEHLWLNPAATRGLGDGPLFGENC